MSNIETQHAAGPTTWNLDPAHSHVEFGVRHMMISTVKGSFSGVEGTIQIDEANLSESSIEVEIDTASIDTRNDDRDNHLRSEDFFHVDEYPKIRFRSIGLEEGRDGHFKLRGELTIRDQTKTVELDVEKLGEGIDPWGNQRFGFRGETRVNRKDFGLTWNQALETGGVLVGDEVRISVEGQAIEAGHDDT